MKLDSYVLRWEIRWKKKRKILRKIAGLLCMVILIAVIPADESKTVYAQTISASSSSTKTIVCGKQAKIKLPSGYSKCKFSTSNKKVAIVNSRGVVKTVRLGTAKITAKSGNKKKTYTITVTPARAGDVRLNYQAVLTSQKFQLKLVSDKYDTSQVRLKFDCGFSKVNSKGFCAGIKNAGWASMEYYYGSFKKSTKLAVYSPDRMMCDILKCDWGDDSGNCNLDAGVPEKTSVTSMVDSGKKITPGTLRKQGISLFVDKEEMADTMIYTPGKHTISIVSGNKEISRKVNISYSVKDALIKRDATGYDAECKEVFDAAFAAVSQIITEGMRDEEKVKAIHDYLIYNADYVNNGDYDSAEKWAYGASGVLLHKEGVCQSYAIVFYMMATAAGVECEYVTGTATNSEGSPGDHAWNRVCLDGIWYYIDCTWDDPIYNGHSGGGERYTYYLSERLWSNHTVEKTTDFASKGKYYWKNYYLTGQGY